MTRIKPGFRASAGALLVLLVSLVASTSLSGAAFTAGNLVVYRFGDGVAALSSNATVGFLDEYTITGGSPVQSIALPVTVVGSNRICSVNGTATSEGKLTLSMNRQYLVFGCYDMAPPTAIGTAGRVLARVGSNGAVDTTTVTTSVTGGNVRSATSLDGSSFWFGTSANGVHYMAYGASAASTQITATNPRAVRISPDPSNVNQLYLSSGSGTIRVASVGTGVPTTTGQTSTNLSGFPTTGSPYAFFFADLDTATPGIDTLYVADDGAGQVQKYSLVSGSWTLTGSVAAAGVTGVTGIVTTGGVQIYAVSASTLFSLTDSSGYNGTLSGTATSIATAGTNRAFRGVAFAPVPPVILVPTCPSPVSATKGVGTSQTLTAIDAGHIVNAASITAITPSDPGGITLSGFVASPSNNTNASVSLDVAGTVAPGSYNVTVHWTNDAAQTADCVVNVVVVDQPIVPTCGTPLTTTVGTPTSEMLTAVDADNIVNGASITLITPSDPGGITLSGFTASPSNNTNASVSLGVAASVPANTYAVTVTWTNDATPTPQTQTCTVSVVVNPLNLPVSPTCASPLNVSISGGSEGVSATDADGTVTSAVRGVITPSDPGSITLTGFSAAAAVGGNASATLNVAAGTPVGTYSVPITWSNNDATPQTATCTVSVVVTNQPVATTTCPASAPGYEGFAFTSSLAASDPDGTVTTAAIGSITPSDPLTITITNLAAAGSVGGTATLDLAVAAATPPGTYSVPVTWSNSDSTPQTATCTVSVVVPTAIHTLQGSGSTSPYAGSSRTTRGIVTARRGNGFFLQSPDANVDAAPNTSEGVFVFTSSAPPAQAAVGNDLTLTATVSEYSPSTDPNSPPFTELTAPSGYVVNSTGNAMPAAAVVTLADTLVSSIENLEKYEGMRVSIPSLTVVSPTQGTVDEANATSTATGVFYGVFPGVARPFREQGIAANDPLPGDAPVGLFIGLGGVPRFDGNPEKIRVNTMGQTGGASILVTTGATASNVVGVLGYDYRSYTVYTDPATPPSVSGNLTSAPPVTAPSSTEFTVATANLQHYYDTVNDPGSDVQLTAAAYARRLAKVSLAVRNNLRFPDILAVEEAEKVTVLQDLSAKISADALANSQPDPLYAAYLQPGNDISDINVGFLVKAATVVGTTPRVSVTAVTQLNLNETWIDSCTGASALLNDRPPLELVGAVHHANGSSVPLTVLVIHDKALSGVDDVSACTIAANGTVGNRERQKRLAQAKSVAAMVQSRQAQNLVVLGDFNAYEFNDGYVDVTGIIAGTGAASNEVVLSTANTVTPALTVLDAAVPAADRYSYIYDGMAQGLDHILVNQSLVSATSARRVEHSHMNSDFPEDATTRGDATRPEKYSDHDPAVAYFTVGSFPVALTSFSVE